MVQLTDDPPEPTEEAVLNGVLVKTRRDYMFFLKEQLEDHLPFHDMQKDDYIKRLQKLQYIPEYVEEDPDQVFQELRQRTEVLLTLQKERKEITAWLWKYYKAKRRPFATLKECRLQIEKLFDGKEKFFENGKQIEELLRKLHGTSEYD